MIVAQWRGIPYFWCLTHLQSMIYQTCSSKTLSRYQLDTYDRPAVIMPTTHTFYSKSSV